MRAREKRRHRCGAGKGGVEGEEMWKVPSRGSDGVAGCERARGGKGDEKSEDDAGKEARARAFERGVQARGRERRKREPIGGRESGQRTARGAARGRGAAAGGTR